MSLYLLLVSLTLIALFSDNYCLHIQIIAMLATFPQIVLVKNVKQLLQPHDTSVKAPWCLYFREVKMTRTVCHTRQEEVTLIDGTRPLSISRLRGAPLCGTFHESPTSWLHTMFHVWKEVTLPTMCQELAPSPTLRVQVSTWTLIMNQLIPQKFKHVEDIDSCQKLQPESCAVLSLAAAVGSVLKLA